ESEGSSTDSSKLVNWRKVAHRIYISWILFALQGDDGVKIHANYDQKLISSFLKKGTAVSSPASLLIDHIVSNHVDSSPAIMIERMEHWPNMARKQVYEEVKIALSVSSIPELTVRLKLAKAVP